MISLYSRDDFAALGLAALLDIERIPYRRIERLAEHDQPLLIALGADLTAHESAQITARRSLVLNGGAAFAEHLFGARQPLVGDCTAVVPLSEPIWPARLYGLASRFGKLALRVPRAPLCRVRARSRGELFAWLNADGEQTTLPAVVAHGDCLWSSLDLGAAFGHLLTESYVPAADRPRAPALRAWARNAAEAAYYAAPERMRGAIQVASYRMLERRLDSLGDRASEYPIDPTGWLLIELMKALIVRAAGSLVRVARWPAGHRAAAILTHDLEPRRYAYTDGLARLLERVAGDGHRNAFGVVATAGTRHLQPAQRAALADYEVFCHGLDHRGEQVWDRARVARTVRSARALVERQFGRPVSGYRSPRLDRSPDLDWALDDAGFTYDSSHPDCDRENLQHYGRGVRLNLPYRPLLEEDSGEWRRSRCLELPLTAPDCIQPLFAGDDVAALRQTVGEKAAFVRASGGLYVALVHAGVFGPADAARRLAHLDFVGEQLRHPDVWLTSPERLVEWWTAREQLRITTAGDAVCVVNDGQCAVADAMVVIEGAESMQSQKLPVLAPGETARVDARTEEQVEGWRTCSLASQ